MNILFAFAMTLIAGLSTGIGSLSALLTKKTNGKFLAVSLGFSAGVMIYVSMIELFQAAQASLEHYFGGRKGSLVTVLAFFGGMLFISLIDKLIPSEQNPHEMKSLEEKPGHAKDSEGRFPEQGKDLLHTGLFTALALALHNFPEGMATFVSALQDLSVAIPVVVAIAIHNIPEGIAVAVPIYFATGNRKKAFFYSFLSGLAEPLGAVVGFLILLPFLNEMVFGIIYGVVAGIMVFISFDELLPAAREYGEHHLSVYGLVAGMLVMAVSLLLFV
ncbi:MAG: zinc transporter ZupT [Clostridium sp.]|jgi:ZIP family zinc transporter|nr:zinc transporter ZupT [Clostridium sp.]